jgi:predicted RNase H-like nuclease (RuvC/YqgF family)
MRAKICVVGLCGVLAMGLAACSSGPTLSEREAEIANLRRQVETQRSQITAKEEEAKRLTAQVAAAKKLEVQVSALEERIKGMQDIVMAKNDEISRLENKLDAAKKKAAAKAPAKKPKPKPAAKSDTKSKETP